MNQGQFWQRPGRNKRYLAVILASLLMLSGCDKSDSTDNKQAAQPQSTEIQSEKAPQQSNIPPKSVKQKDAASLAELARRYAGKPVKILDASEVQLDGASAMVVTFSVPLDPNQDFAQNVRLVDVKEGKLDGAWELSDNLMELRLRHLPPSRELQLTVDKGVKGVNEHQLETVYEKTLTTATISPSVGFASKGSLLPSKVAGGLPVLALNVNRVDVNFFRIKEAALPAFIAQWQYRNNMSSWESEEMLKGAELVYTGRFDLNPTLNTREKLLLPLNNIKELQKDGVYLAVMQQAGKYTDTNPATMFTLSDIGVSMHSYLDRIDVFTQSLAQGSSLKGVEIRLLDEKGQLLSKATTDDDGHVSLEKNAKAKLLLATRDHQTSMIDLVSPALDLSEFDISGPQGYSKQFFVFGPRDLYRPGELLIINGLLRDGDGRAIKSQPVKVDVLKTDGQVVDSFVWQPENGLYQYRYVIPTSAATGLWSLRFDLGDNKPRYYKFNVEDFMPERMALEISSESQPVMKSHDVDFAINGRYLYGAPAAHNRLQGQLFLRPARDAVAKLPGYEFGAVAEDNLSRTLDEFDLVLDSGGKAALNVSADNWSSVSSPVNVIVQASLLESGGRPVTRRVEQAVWPAEKLVGIRPLFNQKEIYDYRVGRYQSRYNVDENSLAQFAVVYADADGKKYAAKDLTARLVYERRDYYWRWSDGEGWQSGYDQKDLVMADEHIQIAQDGTAKVSFPVDWGSYRIEVVNPENQLVTSVNFWAGYSWQDNTGGTGAVRPDQVKLSLDKPAYRVGEKIKLHMVAPQAGQGYLLVESSEGPLWWQKINVPEQGLDVEVPVNKEWRRHDLYLTAVVVRPDDKSRQATPKRAIGVLHLPLADENRKLDLALSAPEKMRPNQELIVKVKATPQQGRKLPKQVNVLLSAVDTGVLNVTNFKTPDPYEAFFGRKRYSVDQYDVYGQLIEGEGRLANLRFGGDGDDSALDRGGRKPLTEVKIIAEQAQPVTLDENGEGQIVLPIPDFNGELRLMAQAWSEDEFGHGESKVVVAAPVVAQMALPRFMAGGDSALLSLDLTNLTEQRQDLILNFIANDLIKLEDDVRQEIILEKGKRTTVEIPVTAQRGFGQGEISLTIDGLYLPGENLRSYKNSWQIGVRPAQPAETVLFANVIHPGEEWQMPSKALSGLSPEGAEGQLLLSSRPPLQISRYIRELYAYPYGCLEQTISGLYPSLYSNKSELNSLGIMTEDDDKRRASIDEGIIHLVSMQRHDGSFALWNKTGDEEYWLTAYATDFLFRASQRGYRVPKEVLTSANNRLLRYLQDKSVINYPYSQNQEAMRFSVQAYAGLVLANQQKAPLGALRQVYERRQQAGNGLSLVQLGIALKLMGDNTRADEAVRLGISKNRNDDLDLGDYGSAIRDNAMIVALLTENNMLIKERDEKLLALSDELTSRNYFSTQESNSLYLAGRFFIDVSEQPWKALFSQWNSPISRDKPYNEMLYPQDIQQDMSISNLGDSTIYSRVNVVAYPLRSPKPYANVLKIERSYLDMKGNPISSALLNSGDMVVVKLVVSSDKPVQDALVVDLLPAGLELENQNLANSSAKLSESAANLQELIDDMQQATIRHIEYRDDRYVAAVAVDPSQPVTLLYLARAVTPGVYTVPAPQVESMYVPYWRAVGKSIPEKIAVDR
ncbi:alpha-2-macroglobulin family protein [Photorhabdus caribbeanensis]|uniref:alpha-2-macroglobulin family protein n=1 Tax=Photorhabdus caribbeanensis TaxID=1004165 RepID=UPI001BD2A287|nr:alpha-2-macroglobulin [Photorhabdus caribbeanensis]MBS9424850.1 alpha-2-macroglobulin family protein [Photorhabdus caribbeanensis]